MAGALESKAFFLERCSVIGISDDTVVALDAKRYGTMASWAFCCSYVPGAASEEPLLSVIDEDPASTYANCSDARAAGVTPIRQSDSPGRYAANQGLDRDGDGVACE